MNLVLIAFLARGGYGFDMSKLCILVFFIDCSPVCSSLCTAFFSNALQLFFVPSKLKHVTRLFSSSSCWNELLMEEKQLKSCATCFR